MLPCAPAPGDPEPAAASAAASARARALAEQQIALLGKLARIGLEVAAVVGEQARAEAAGTVEAGPVAPAMAYARVSRAVRLTVALQARISKDLEALEQGAGLDADADAGETAGAEGAEAGRLNARRRRIERVVRRVIADDLDNSEDDVERLSAALWERLCDPDIYGDLSSRPLGVIVEKICEDLHVPVNWYRLANEAWAVAETAEADPRSPFVTLARELERISRPEPPRGGAP